MAWTKSLECPQSRAASRFPNFNSEEKPFFILMASRTTLLVTKLIPLCGDSWLNEIPVDKNKSCDRL